MNLIAPKKEGKEMKSSMVKLMLATAALMVASTVASAQTMMAEIPFAFQAGENVMAPGTYQVTAYDGQRWFLLVDLQSGRHVSLVSGTGHDPQPSREVTTDGALQFACGDGGCRLKTIWTNTGYPA